MLYIFISTFSFIFIQDHQRTNDLLLNLDSVLLKVRVVAVVCWVCCFNL